MSKVPIGGNPVVRIGEISWCWYCNQSCTAPSRTKPRNPIFVIHPRRVGLANKAPNIASPLVFHHFHSFNNCQAFIVHQPRGLLPPRSGPIPAPRWHTRSPKHQRDPLWQQECPCDRVSVHH